VNIDSLLLVDQGRGMPFVVVHVFFLIEILKCLHFYLMYVIEIYVVYVCFNQALKISIFKIDSIMIMLIL
jgi:hypothetical protein